MYAECIENIIFSMQLVNSFHLILACSEEIHLRCYILHSSQIHFNTQKIYTSMPKDVHPLTSDCDSSIIHCSIIIVKIEIISLSCKLFDLNIFLQRY